MIRITDSIALPDSAITERFVRATGDHGQNLHKDATAVELRFTVPGSALPRDIQDRLIALGGRHVTKAGVLVVVSRSSRSQAQNRESAHARLLALLKRAARPPKVRRPTGLPSPLRQDRLAAKHRQAAVKRTRRPPGTNGA